MRIFLLEKNNMPSCQYTENNRYELTVNDSVNCYRETPEKHIITIYQLTRTLLYLV